MKEFDNNSIDDFLLGRMEESDLKEFKNKLSMDKEFANRVQQRQESVRYIDILGDLALRDRVQRLHKEAVKNLPAKKTFSIRPFLKYAAAIAFILVAGYWFLQGPASSQDIFQNNYQAYELNFGDHRGGAPKDIAFSAGQLYANGEYKKALELFNTIPEDQMTAKVTLAKGISFLETTDYKNATIAFQKLITNKDIIYEDHAKWYLAMTFLKEEKDTEAKNLLQEIADKPGSYNQQKAKDILKKL